ncbi:MAG: GntR family transcriptional regulator [Lachnospiraceae bacterium]|nr:GntR family transcriptional regulator [Lachnospiraceae bacterium]
MIMLDYKDTRPIYEQVVEKFQTLILKGVLEPDEQLPSVRSLAVELSINPNTIQRAYGELERQGFIYTVKGRGGFVRYNENLLEVKKERLKKQLLEVFKEAEELNISVEELVEQLQKGGGERIEHD